jgi:hypothetical protein
MKPLWRPEIAALRALALIVNGILFGVKCWSTPLSEKMSFLLLASMGRRRDEWWPILRSVFEFRLAARASAGRA